MQDVALPATRDAAPPVPDAAPPVPDVEALVADAAPAAGNGTSLAASTRPSGLAKTTASVNLLDHPGFAPELLALAAVRRLGPPAAAWARQTRAAYPGATSERIARLAARRFVRLAAAGGAASAAAGLFAPVAELAAVAWTNAALVLHVAAAYGQDPAHPERAAELLVLTQVHPDEQTARAALDAAATARSEDDQPLRYAAEAAWRLTVPLAAQTGGWLALRFATRLVPGAAILAAAAGDSAAAERLAARAIARYRAQPADPPTAS